MFFFWRKLCALFFGANLEMSDKGREENCSAGGGGGARKPICPAPPPLLGRRDGRGGFRAGVPDLPCRGGGGQPNIYGSK